MSTGVFFGKKLQKVEICHFYDIFSKGGLVKKHSN
jgi:hypothetical protein